MRITEILTIREKLQKKWMKRNVGTMIALFFSAVLTYLLLPSVKNIRIIKIGECLASIGKDISEVTIFRRYSSLNFLSFVRETGAGILGFPAFIIFLIHCTCLLLVLVFIVMVLINKPGQQGYLKLYTFGKWAGFMTMVLSAAVVWYTFGYASNHTYPGSFAPSFTVYLEFAVGLVLFFITANLQADERVRYHKHSFAQVFKKHWILFIFLIPCFVFFIINNYAPMTGIYFAFTKFNFRDGLFASPFVGWNNFRFIIKSDLPLLTKNTILYNLVFIIVGNVLQIFFAILISQIKITGVKRVTQTLIFLPHFVSFVILKVLTYSLLEYDSGLLNALIVSSGGKKIDFYNTPSYWPFFIIFANIWKGTGYGTIVYLASIMGISDEYYDAAKVDGANIFQQIRFITIPQLKPTFIILLLYSLGGLVRGNFELFYQMVGTNGALFKVTDILDAYVYRITLTQPLSMGYGTAAGLYQSVFGLIVVLTVNFIIKRRNEEYALF